MIVGEERPKAKPSVETRNKLTTSSPAYGGAIDAALFHVGKGCPACWRSAGCQEDASAATESMKVQADALLKMVARFNLGELGNGYVGQARSRRQQPQVLEMARLSRLGRWIRRRMARTGAGASIS